MAARSAETEELRRQFIAEYADKAFSSPEKNRPWIKAALASPAFRQIFTQIENGMVKSLNKKFGNKDFVTALTNYHKELFLKKFDKELQDLMASHYSDFKTERHFFSEPLEPSVFARIEKVFVTSTEEFYADKRIRQMVRAGDLEDGWFALGIGFSADESSLAAKYARKTKRKIAYFWQSEVQDFFVKKYQRIRELNKELQALSRLDNLFEHDGKMMSLKLEVFTASRKAETPLQLHLALIQQFKGTLITSSDAALLKEFSDLCDTFTPPLLIEDRERLMIHDAPFGAITLDFLGLGAENIKATAQALILSENMADGIHRARVNEQKVTEEFKKNKEIIRREFQAFFDGQVTIRFSGDDAVIIPHREFLASDINQFMKHLAQLFPRPFFRMAMITKEGAKLDSSQLTTQGEEIEKALRAKILEKSGVELSRNLTMNAFLWDSGGTRKVVMIVGMKRQLSRVEKQALKQAFETAVKAVENEYRINGSSLSLDPADIYAIAE